MARRVARRWDEERTKLLGQNELFVQEGKGGERYFYAWLQEPEVESCPLCSGKAIKMQDLFSKTYQELIHKGDDSAVVTLEYGFHMTKRLWILTKKAAQSLALSSAIPSNMLL